MFFSYLKYFCNGGHRATSGWRATWPKFLNLLEEHVIFFLRSGSHPCTWERAKCTGVAIKKHVTIFLSLDFWNMSQHYWLSRVPRRVSSLISSEFSCRSQDRFWLELNFPFLDNSKTIWKNWFDCLLPEWKKKRKNTFFW